jgi:hypothetical protein
MLRLPGEHDSVPPLVIPVSDEEDERDPLSEVGAPEQEEEDVVLKKRRRSRKKEEVFDETFARKKEVDPKLFKALIGTLVSMALVLAVALLWPSGDDSDQDAGGGLELDVVEDRKPEKDDLAIEAERAVVAPKFIEDELLPVIRKFMDAKSPEEMAQWTRNADISLPRIKEFYGADFPPPGFSAILWSWRPRRIGNAIRVSVQDLEFEDGDMYFVDEDGWKVDWETWAGWSEMGWEELKESRPVEPVLFRVYVSDVEYYNFSFANESYWSSYRLESKDGEHHVFGYVPRGAELDSRLRSLEGAEKRPFVLKVRFPEDAPSASQVIVEEIIAENWFVLDGPS